MVAPERQAAPAKPAYATGSTGSSRSCRSATARTCTWPSARLRSSGSTASSSACRHRALEARATSTTCVGPDHAPERLWEVLATGDVDFAYQMGQGRALPRQPLPQERGIGGGFPPDPVEDADGRGARPAPLRRRPLAVPNAASSWSRGRRAAASPRRSPRCSTASTSASRTTSSRSRTRSSSCTRTRSPSSPSARSAPTSRASPTASGRHPRGPRLPARRRDARPRDDPHGADGRGDGPARLRERSTRTPRRRPSTGSSMPFPPASRSRSGSCSRRLCARVVAQQLLRKKDRGRVAAYEVLLGSTALSNAIREGKTNLINNQIQTGGARGWSRWTSP